MVIRENDLTAEKRTGMRGGTGTVSLSLLPTLFPNCRFGGIIELKQGVSIGQHPHEGESELYFILQGTADYMENGVQAPLFEGDFALCRPGEAHAITGTSDQPCRLLALIVLA